MRQERALSTLQDNLELLRGVEAKSEASLDSARAKEKRLAVDYLKLKKALESKIEAMQQDLDGTSGALAEATALKANSEGQVAVCEQDVKTAKEYLVQLERSCMEKAARVTSCKLFISIYSYDYSHCYYHYDHDD